MNQKLPMDRRLFVGQVIAGISLLSFPSSLVARPTSIRSDALRTAKQWTTNGSLGTLQHVTLSHTYSPEHTSVPALMALLRADLTEINQLLGTNFTILNQAALGLASSEYGSHWVEAEQNGIKLTWQGLARLGGEARKLSAQLRLVGSKGTVQAAADSNGYQFIDWQGRTGHNQFNTLAKRFNRRALFATGGSSKLSINRG